MVANFAAQMIGRKKIFRTCLELLNKNHSAATLKFLYLGLEFFIVFNRNVHFEIDDDILCISDIHVWRLGIPIE